MPFRPAPTPTAGALTRRIRRLAKKLDVSAHLIPGRGWIIAGRHGYVFGYDLSAENALAALQQREAAIPESIPEWAR